MTQALSSAGTPLRSDRSGVPAPGCLVALMVPIVLVLLAAGILMIMIHRQNSANGRHEHKAVEVITRNARSYEDAMQNETRNGYPSRARTLAIAKQHYGLVVSYQASDRSMATRVEFFATYEEKNLFGTSMVPATRCYSLSFQRDDSGTSHRTTSPLQPCGRN